MQAQERVRVNVSYIHNFTEEIDLKNSNMKKLLGTKGFHLAEMSKLSLPIPPGFTITTEVCQHYFKNNKTLPASLLKETHTNIKFLEEKTGKKFGGAENPLLISVRSGSEVSMPGMMDTILNLGINDKVAESLGKITGDYEFAYDCYVRFILMFSEVVLGINHYVLEKAKNEFLQTKNLDYSAKLSLGDTKNLITMYKNVIADNDQILPEDPYEQLELAIEAVINSWNSQRAQIYRKLHHICDKIGTAVTVQSMVFGNYNDNSGTGVVFTRNPVNGENEIYGEYIIKAQGEDIVAGKKTPLPLSDSPNSLEFEMPAIYQELKTHCKNLENKYKDMQDIEFTIESGKLYILQTRSGKRAAKSAIKIAHDLACEKLISKNEAIMMINSNHINQLLHPTVSKNSKLKPVANGLAASPGAANGKVVFCSEAAEILAKSSNVILLRHDTCPEDIKGISLSKGIITARGGLTSHAAVVARGMGKPCICGTSEIEIDTEKRRAKIGNIIINEYDDISMDGGTGEIYIGSVELEQADTIEEFDTILEWADEVRTLKIRSNAETEQDVTTSIKFGAEGIGLCRTEHMFFEKNKISLVRQMILRTSLEERQKVLDAILPLHKEDFISILRPMGNKPINIRLIDPPLHEFLPSSHNEIKSLAEEMDIDIEIIQHQLERLKESNPMIGHRGCRLGITHPDIYEMQVNAIISAAIFIKKSGTEPNIEIMVPLIATEAELIFLKDLIVTTAEKIMAQEGHKINYKIGTMIELPRACMIAGNIAKHVEYFSFGTNDLTQTVYGISRDDVASFMPEYKSLDIFKFDPFTSLDVEGVGNFITMAIERGKQVNKKLSVGICGEHAGDPESIDFFHNSNVDYISCSPYRIPIARLYAARSGIVSSISK